MAAEDCEHERSYQKQVNERLELWNTAFSAMTSRTWCEGSDPTPHDVLQLAKWMESGEG